MFNDTKTKWIPENNAMIENDDELLVLVSSAADCINFCGYFLNHLSENGDIHHQIFHTICRAIGQIKASIDLLSCGYYAESMAVLRCAFELTNILACTITDETILQKWINAEPKDYKPNGAFAPWKLRKEAAIILDIEKKILDSTYHNLCMLSTHPDNNGIFFFETEDVLRGSQRCNREQAKGLLEEIAQQAYLLARATSLHKKGPETTPFDMSFIPNYLEKKESAGEFIGLCGIKNENFGVKIL